MSWFRMDDKFHSHLKVITAGNAAVGLFARAGCWCSDHCSDGLIPTPVAAMLGKPKEIEALLAAGLWAKVDGGYVMPDFLEFNPSAAEVAERRAKRAEAGAVGGRKSSASRQQASTQANASNLLDESLNHVADASQANVNPDPTRPDPLLVQVSRQTDSLDTWESVVCRALELYADAQTPGSHVVDVGKWRRGVIRNARTEHAATISGNPDATDIELAGLMLGTNGDAPRPPREAWYEDPHCLICGGTGVRVVDDGGAGTGYPCDCRRPEPYLAQVIELRQETA